MKMLLAALGAGVVLVAGVVVGPGLVASSGDTALVAGASLNSATAKTYKNCTQLNKKYPHGVGRPGAVDKVRGSTKPVKNFYVNAALYKANKKSDRDGDGVACEKR